jgi:subtilisin family serine protease
MKRLLRIASAALILFSTLSTASAADTPAGSFASAEPDRLIVVTVADNVRVLQGRVGSTPRGYDVQRYTSSSAARAVMKAIAGDYHLTQLAEWPIPLLKVHCAVFRIPKDVTQAAVLEMLKSEPRVRLAQPMGVFETHSETYNDPYVGLQSGFKQLDVADAHGISRGEGVKVAVIDTGVDITHPDLANRVVATRDLVGGTAEQFRRDRHGTEVSGVIAALANNHLGIVGIAPAARLFALKACWQLTDDSDSARCNSFTLAKAISAAIDMKSQVVNLSLGGPSDPLLAQLVASGIQRGIVFVGAASGTGPGFPQDVPGVLVVSASESTIPPGRWHLHAPGREILTLLPKGHYDFASGSSLAAAHVTGTVALMLAHHPDLDASRIYDLLDRTSSPLLATDSALRSINACAALTSVDRSGITRTSSNDPCDSAESSQTARAGTEHRY